MRDNGPGLSEEQAAFRRLQRLASDKNLKLVEIARAIVTGTAAVQEAGP